MKYFVTLGARTLEVVVDGERVEVDGRVLNAHLSPVPETPLRHLLLGSESYTLAMEPTEAGWAVAFRGERQVIEVVDERTRHIRSLTGEGRKSVGGGQLRAPMPGLVLRIQVEEGQAVAAGQPIVALEAMKMENELRASGPGVVRTIAVKPGQAVEKGAVLVEFVAAAT
ncbi:MAG TPA: biotin/lipoyl-containing protein [Gemmatimonadales bacterium]|nr:biotin/lipoyl-containing protein [Gemmatimonadales bacterium]